jgi:hypothetical protein
VDKTKEDVLSPDVVVVEEPRLFLGENNNSSSPVGEPFKHLASPHKTLHHTGSPEWFGEYSDGAFLAPDGVLPAPC